MPLFKAIEEDSSFRLLIWKIEESEKVLEEGITLTKSCKERLGNMRSEIHRRGFLSVRQLLKLLGYTPADLYYDKNGKPHLKDGSYISITHSFDFAAVIVSSNKEVGIDIEKRRDKILRIAHKFTPIHEYRTLANSEAVIRKLTLVWGAKEALYKIFATPGLLFLEHIFVEDFGFEELCTQATISYRGKISKFQVHFLELENFSCAYAQPIDCI
ncbi:MAG: 4'-phosphopantetheinyl transferase superfamily protein [Flavobacteriaceae bacterium]|nr:4'-phosphopantetheinyl transferase superfamily protein [Flavobacteriaceae bacterium]